MHSNNQNNNHPINYFKYYNICNNSLTLSRTLIKNYGFDAEGLQAFLQNYNVASLDLSNCHIRNKAASQLAGILAHNTTLKHLDLTHNEISDEFIAQIVRASKIPSLSLGENYIGWENVMSASIAISNNRYIRKLNLSGSWHVSEECLSQILLNKHITDLNIEGTGISLQVIEAITKHPTISQLDISRSQYQSLDYRAANVLAKNKSIKTLIADNTFDSKNSETLLRSLAQNKSLTELSLCENNLRPTTIRGLSTNDRIQVLNLSSLETNNFLAQHSVSLLVSKFPNICELSLIRCNLKDNVIRAIANHPQLISIDLAHNLLSDSSVEVLVANTNIQILNLSGNPHITTKGIKLLAQSKTIKHLHLNDNLIGDYQAQLFANSTVEMLSLDENLIGDNGVMILAQNPFIKFLYLMANRFTDIGALALAGNVTCHIIGTDDNKLNKISKAALSQRNPINCFNYRVKSGVKVNPVPSLYDLSLFKVDQYAQKNNHFLNQVASTLPKTIQEDLDLPHKTRYYAKN